MKLFRIGESELAVEPIFAQEIHDPETVVIFLHEALGSIGQWKGFPQQVCNVLGLNGIVYEREGHGHSSALQKPRDSDYLHRAALDELPALLRQLLAPEKKVLLSGQSDGATIALLYAHYFPSNIIGIVSIAAHVVVESVTIEGIAPAVKAFQEGKLNGLQRYHGDKTTDLFYAWSNTWTSNSFADWNICAELSNIQAPILAMQGIQDQYGTLQQLELMEQYAGAPVQKVVLQDCGHHPHLEKSEDVIRSIHQWYKSL